MKFLSTIPVTKPLIVVAIKTKLGIPSLYPFPYTHIYIYLYIYIYTIKVLRTALKAFDYIAEIVNESGLYRSITKIVNVQLSNSRMNSFHGVVLHAKLFISWVSISPAFIKTPCESFDHLYIYTYKKSIILSINLH